jgi:serine/threonine protein kinase
MAHAANFSAADFPLANAQAGGAAPPIPPRATSRVGATPPNAPPASRGDSKSLEPNTTITGGYKLIRLVGRGNFAKVWEATDARGERVAVKILHSSHPQGNKRFQREIKVVRSLPANEHVVQYVDHGVLPDGSPFLVLEFVVGFTLGQLLSTGRRFSEQAACSLMLQLCRSFAGLHALGVTHGDIKPNNIMLAKSASAPSLPAPNKAGKEVIHLAQVERSSLRIKLLDFGLVRDAQGLLKLLEQHEMLPGKDFAEELDVGMLAGTPEYIAPEQLIDARREEHEPALTDTPSDVFGLGVVFYQLITGVVPWPFEPDSRDAEAYRHSIKEYLGRRAGGERPECPPGTSQALWSIIARALDPDPKKRQGDALALFRDIERFVEYGVGVPANLDTEETVLAYFDAASADVEKESAPIAELKPLPPPPVAAEAPPAAMRRDPSDLIPAAPPAGNRNTMTYIIVAACVAAGVAAAFLF